MASEDGGPLFLRHGDKEICQLTVRDWFASFIMLGLAFRDDTYPYHTPDDDICGQETAHTAYVMADKMIAERAKTKSE